MSRSCIGLGMVALLTACDPPRLGGAGESCTKGPDCEADLRCVDQVCVGEAPAAHPSTTPPPTESGEPAPAPPPPAERQAATVLAGLVPAKGPFATLDAYCKPRREALECGPDEASGTGTKNAEIVGLGRVELVGIGDELSKQIGLAFSLPSGLYVAEDLSSETAGSDLQRTLETTSITPAAERGQLVLEFHERAFERVYDENDDRPGYLIPKSETEFTVRYTCGLDASGVPGCTPPETRKRVIDDGSGKPRRAPGPPPG